MFKYFYQLSIICKQLYSYRKLFQVNNDDNLFGFMAHQSLLGYSILESVFFNGIWFKVTQHNHLQTIII